MGFLIDTCVWIDVERGLLAPADVATLTVYMSLITIAEPTVRSRGRARTANPPAPARRAASIRRIPLVVLDAVTGDIFGRLAYQLCTSRENQ